MRSIREIVYRARQEAGNLGLLARPPVCDNSGARAFHALPGAACACELLKGTPFAADIRRMADEIAAHRFRLPGAVIETGEDIAWRRDYLSGIETEPVYFRTVPYLDAAVAGDHKVIWELNRHQHFVLLAQAWGFTGERVYLDEIARQWSGWLRQNPYLRGINWASALEVAFRALAWLWTYQLAGPAMDGAFRQALETELYRHGRYLENNLSVYFSPNTHLLGEAVALYALGKFFSHTARGPLWEGLGRELVEQQMLSQVREDGSHFEQSSYYHVYALDMFLYYRALAGSVPEPFDLRLERMAEFLDALTGPSGRVPLLGDDDGGRLFHPYGARDHFAGATLATCAAALGRREWLRDAADLDEQAAWWLDRVPLMRGEICEPAASRLFPQAGVAVMRCGETAVTVDAGPMGPGSAGHSHSDALSMVMRRGGNDLLIDAGTYTYVGDERGRNWFRGSAAHNTVRIDGVEQADPAGPFRWGRVPAVQIERWETRPRYDALDANCRYRGFVHRRRVLFAKPDLIFVLDEIGGPGGTHFVEQFWHSAEEPKAETPGCFRIDSCTRLVLPAEAAAEHGRGGEYGWRSRAFGERQEAGFVRVNTRGELPRRLAAAIDLSGRGACTLRLTGEQGGIRLVIEGARTACAWFTGSACGIKE